MSTALTIQERAKTALVISKTEDELRALAKASADIVKVTNADGREQVHASMMVLKNTRIEIEKLGKAAREDATQFSKAVIAEEKRLVGLIAGEETRLASLRDAWDKAIEDEKERKILAEAARTTAITNRIETIRAWPSLAVGKPSALIEQQLRTANDYQLGDFFQEFTESATQVLAYSRSQLTTMLAAQKAHEDEQAEVKRKLAELEVLKADQAKRDAETARLAKIESDRVAAEQKAERERLDAQRREIEKQQREADAKIAAERKAHQDELDRQAREAKALRDAEDKRQAEARAELERQQEEMRKAQEPIVLQTERPSQAEIVLLVANHWGVETDVALQWIYEIQLEQSAAA